MHLRREGKGRGELGEDRELPLGNMLALVTVVNVFSFMIFSWQFWLFLLAALDIGFLTNRKQFYI